MWHSNDDESKSRSQETRNQMSQTRQKRTRAGKLCSPSQSSSNLLHNMTREESTMQSNARSNKQAIVGLQMTCCFHRADSNRICSMDMTMLLLLLLLRADYAMHVIATASGLLIRPTESHANLASKASRSGRATCVSLSHRWIPWWPASTQAVPMGFVGGCS